MASSISKNLLNVGTVLSSLYLWIFILAICSPTRIFALSTNDRPDESSPAVQLRLSNLKNSIESLQQQQQQDQEHQPLQQPSYLIEPSYFQLPAINRLLSRYPKRSWQNLQSSWGKRDGVVDGLDAIDELSADDYADLLLLLSKPYATDVGGRQFIDENNNGELINDEDLIATGEKRAWNKMNASWGKRLAGARNNNGNNNWGKREPGWNNLKGLWGKRATWNKLQNGWGKRNALKAK